MRRTRCRSPAPCARRSSRTPACRSSRASASRSGRTRRAVRCTSARSRSRRSSIPHDAPHVALRVSAGGRRFGIATDLGHATRELRALLQGCDLVMLEANHCPAMLEAGPYPPRLKQRVGRAARSPRQRAGRRPRRGARGHARLAPGPRAPVAHQQLAPSARSRRSAGACAGCPSRHSFTASPAARGRR